MKNRDSNLELCRIMAMIFITFNHITSLGGTIVEGIFDGNTIISCLFLCGGKFGTNVFVVIGVYFLSSSNFKFDRVFRIWCQTLFYSLLLNVIDVICFGNTLSTKYWIKSLLPVLGRNYWYSSAYILLLLMIPVLDGMYRKFKVNKCHIILGLVILSIIPTVTFNGSVLGNSRMLYWLFKILMFGPTWFCFMYILIKYLKDSKFFLFKRKTYILLFAGSYFAMLFIMVILYLYGLSDFSMHTFVMEHFSTIRDMSSILCLIAALSFFMIFLKTEVNYNKYINGVSSCIFGIYLLQCHVISEQIFWKGCSEWSGSPWYCLYSVLLVVLIFLIGCIVEIIRKNIEENFLKMNMTKRFINFMQNSLDNVYSKIKIPLED